MAGIVPLGCYNGDLNIFSWSFGNVLNAQTCADLCSTQPLVTDIAFSPFDCRCGPRGGAPPEIYDVIDRAICEATGYRIYRLTDRLVARDPCPNGVCDVEAPVAGKLVKVAEAPYEEEEEECVEDEYEEVEEFASKPVVPVEEHEKPYHNKAVVEEPCNLCEEAKKKKLVQPACTGPYCDEEVAVKVVEPCEGPYCPVEDVIEEVASKSVVPICPGPDCPVVKNITGNKAVVVEECPAVRPPPCVAKNCSSVAEHRSGSAAPIELPCVPRVCGPEAGSSCVAKQCPVLPAEHCVPVVCPPPPPAHCFPDFINKVAIDKVPTEFKPVKDVSVKETIVPAQKEVVTYGDEDLVTVSGASKFSVTGVVATMLLMAVGTLV